MPCGTSKLYLYVREAVVRLGTLLTAARPFSCLPAHAPFSGTSGDGNKPDPGCIRALACSPGVGTSLGWRVEHWTNALLGPIPSGVWLNPDFGLQTGVWLNRKSG